MEIVFGYIRVSTIEQESGQGPDVQRQAILSYCKSKGLNQPEFITESMSGETVHARAEFCALLSRAEEEQTAGNQVHIVFRSSDRLSRELISQEAVVAKAFHVGYRLHSTLAHEAELFDPSGGRDPMRVAIRQFFGIMNQLDKAIIEQRMSGGLFMKASKGGSTGGRYPFGYQSMNGEIAIDPSEAPVVRRVFEESEQGHTLQGITDTVMKEFPEHCRHWKKSQVKRILDRADLYVGGWYRSRVAVSALQRRDLIIVFSQTFEQAPVPAGPIDWAKVPDPVGLHTLAMLVRQSVPWCQAIIKQEGLMIRWEGKKMLLPHDSARQVAVIAFQ